MREPTHLPSELSDGLGVGAIGGVDSILEILRIDVHDALRVPQDL